MTEFENQPTYEIMLPNHIHHKKFEEMAAAGTGKFWLICTQRIGMHRFKGLMHPEDQDKPDIRIFLDIGADFCYVTTPGKQALTALEVAKEVRDDLRGTKIYKDGIEVQEIGSEPGIEKKRLNNWRERRCGYDHRNKRVGTGQRQQPSRVRKQLPVLLCQGKCHPVQTGDKRNMEKRKTKSKCQTEKA